MPVLKLGDNDPSVKLLQDALKNKGFDPGAIDGDFGPATESAVVAFQKSEGLVADGVAGPRTQQKLGLVTVASLPDITSKVTPAMVVKMFPGTHVGNIHKHLPFVLAELSLAGIGDRVMVLAALATIRAETAQFVPISEGISRFNTSPNGHPFDLYDNRNDLGNQGRPDGDSYKGRGFVQLTGRANYRRIGGQIGVPLENEFELANDAKTAAKILAAFLQNKESCVKDAMASRDFATARRCVNGGSHGLQAFTDCYVAGEREIPAA